MPRKSRRPGKGHPDPPLRVRGQGGLPALPGTGVIAGNTVRAVLESAGVHDVLTKSRGSTNPMNLVRATVDALTKLRTKDQIARLRGVTI
ncbi:MAG: hypothetical protein HY290_05255 [Planctomycetia bacterium]|nr:hypothetical protein [Planctomycetia bacterium]